MTLTKLKELFPNLMTTGAIFTALQELDVPWKEASINVLLDVDYIGNRSGNKIISNLVDLFVTDGTLSSSSLGILAETIFAFYGDKWARLWATLNLEYNPIQNYNMNEVMRGDETIKQFGHSNTRTNDLTHGKTGTESDKPGSTTTETDTTLGFNSSEPVETGGKETVTSGEDVTEYNTSETDTGTVTDVAGGRDVETRNYSLSRSGNIGVTTTQDMIQSERLLWQWDFFKSVVYPDVDRVLTIEIY